MCSPSLSSRNVILAASIAVLITAARLQAATVVWDGGGADNNLTTPGNWIGDAAPAANDALVFDGLTRLAPVNDYLAGTAFDGLTFALSGGDFVLSGNAITLNGGIAVESTSAQIHTPLIVNGVRTVDVGFSELLIGPGALGSGVISGTGGIWKTGFGPLTLGAENTYSGPTILEGGTLTYGADNLALGALNFGITPTVSTVSNATSVLDLASANLTAANLTVQTNSSTPNVIQLGAGKTLTINGAVTVGVSEVFTNTQVAGDPVVRTALTAAGGTFIVNAGGGHFTVGIPRSNAAGAGDPASTVDLAGLTNFIYTASGGELRVGGGNVAGTMRLSNTSNTITASQIRVGDSGLQPPGGGGNNNGGTSTLTLGAGTNVLNANNIVIGAVKSPATVEFQDFLAGSVTIAGQAGGASTANITVGSASSATGSNVTSQLNLAGHMADVQAGTVIVGRLAGGTGGTGAGSITFDTGTFTVSSLQLAVNSTGSAPNGAVGTFILGGAFPNDTADGVLNVTTQFFLANRTNTANLTAPAIGRFIINGGTANVNADIIDASTAGDPSTRTTTLTLAGGKLNMMGHAIGSSTAPITFVNLPGFGETATLANLGGAGINGNGLSLNGGGTLILDGLNTYTGATAIGLGTLRVGAGADSGSLGSGPVANDGVLVFNRTGVLTVEGDISGTGSLLQEGAGTIILAGTNTYAGGTEINAGTLSVTGSLDGAISIKSGGVLAGSGDGATTGLAGNLTMAAGSGLRPGTTGISGDAGLITLEALTVNGGDFHFDLGEDSDAIRVTGAANFTGASTITPNPAAPAGTYTVLSAGSLNLGTAPTVNAPAGTRKSFAADYGTPNAIKLVVTGLSKSLTWTGSVSGVWDTGAAGTLNWTDGAASERFFNGDTVTLGDGATNRTITIPIEVQPQTVTVNHTGGAAYVMSGAGGIGGGAELIKSGAGTLTLNGANSYTGGTTLNQGRLNVNHPEALGSGLLQINGGTIDNSSAAPVTLLTNIPQTWGGSFAFGGTERLNLGAGAVTLTVSQTIDVIASTLEIGGPISGIFVLTKAGAGALTLAGANTFSGGLTLQQGTLNIGHPSALGTGPLTITGGALDNTSGLPATLSGNNAQQWNADVLFIGTNSLNLGTGAVAFEADRTVTVNASTLTVGGLIGGPFNLTKTGEGTLVLGGASNYFGRTTISAGRLTITNAGGGNSSLGATDGGEVTVASGATLDLSGNMVAQQLNFGAKRFIIAGAGAGGNGAIVNDGVSQFNALQHVALTTNAVIGGSQRFDIRSVPTTALNATLDLAGHTLTKSGANQFSLVGVDVSDGNIVVNQGTFGIETVTNIPDFGTGTTITYNAGVTALFFSNTAATSTVTRPMVFNGAGIQIGSASNNNTSVIGSDILLNGDVTFTNLNNTNNTSFLTLTGDITEAGGPRGITKNGPSNLILTGSNSYSGMTTINGGRLQIGNGFASGTLGSGPVVNHALLAFNPAGDVTVSNAISGTGALQMEGFSTLTLSGNSDFTGPTNINSGTVVISGSLSGTAGVNIEFGVLKLAASERIADQATVRLGSGSLETDGFGETLGPLTLEGFSTIDLGSAASTLRFADSSNNLWFGDLSIFNWSGSPAGGGADQIIFGNSDSALTVDQLALIQFVNPEGYSPGSYAARLLFTGELVVIPEPGSLNAMLAGAALLLGMRRRRAQRTASPG